MDFFSQQNSYEGKKKIIIDPQLTATGEEFENFMHRVTEVEKIMNKLNSSSLEDQNCGMILADKILQKNSTTGFSDNEELKIKTNRTLINKYSSNNTNPNKISQESFKHGIEQDVKDRQERRKINNERADTYKRIGNGAFREAKYEKAVTYFTKALERRKDSAVIWNNRALSYMALGLYEKALVDCDWALRVNKKNIKALLNSAKCHKLLAHDKEYREFLKLARKRNPELSKYITEFEHNLESVGTIDSMNGFSACID